jgi:hypothetical protein
MPLICEFYPGMNPVVYRQITIRELNDLIEHRNNVVEQQRKAAEQQTRR